MVKAKTYGGTDVAELRREIERQYPSARIEGLEKQSLIRIVDEKSEMREEKPSSPDFPVADMRFQYNFLLAFKLHC